MQQSIALKIRRYSEALIAIDTAIEPDNEIVQNKKMNFLAGSYNSTHDSIWY